MRLSVKEARALLKSSKCRGKTKGKCLPVEDTLPSKYLSKKTTIDNIVFDSQKEAEFYSELKLLQRTGVIDGFELQPEFILQEGFTREGKRYRPIKYRADFRVYYPDGRIEIVDVKPSKSFKTKEYRLKKKLLLFKFPDIQFKEIY
ncbi:MAG: DUF1064 domain-containing protein [Syntrophomonadaceae bacterium]|nr:DUF1064 domain-containing protein [Syntrophomonadaceae bacterium]